MAAARVTDSTTASAGGDRAEHQEPPAAEREQAECGGARDADQDRQPREPTRRVERVPFEFRGHGVDAATQPLAKLLDVDLAERARRCSGAPWVSAGPARAAAGRCRSRFCRSPPRAEPGTGRRRPWSARTPAEPGRRRSARRGSDRGSGRRGARSIASDRSSGVADGGRLVSLVLGSERLCRRPTGNLPRWLWGRHFGAEGERSGPCPEQGPLRSPPGASTQACGLQGQVALLGKARGHPGRLQVGLPGGRRLAGHLEQVPPHRLEPVSVGHPLVGVEGAQEREAGARSVPSRPRRRGSA